MANINVTVGAQIDELTAGLDRAVGAIESFKGKIEGFAHSLEAVLGISLSVVGIVEFTKHLGELGAQAETSAQTVGLSGQQFLELRGTAMLTGTSIESVSMGLQRMTLNIQRATRDGTNPAAQALSVLHLRAQDIIGQQ